METHKNSWPSKQNRNAYGTDGSIFVFVRFSLSPIQSNWQPVLYTLMKYTHSLFVDSNDRLFRICNQLYKTNCSTPKLRGFVKPFLLMGCRAHVWVCGMPNKSMEWSFFVHTRVDHHRIAFLPFDQWNKKTNNEIKNQLRSYVHPWYRKLGWVCCFTHVVADHHVHA